LELGVGVKKICRGIALVWGNGSSINFVLGVIICNRNRGAYSRL